jgi:ADP-ribose pyrophosphatase
MDRELRERLIASEPVFQGRLISVRVDEVELPDGRRTRREVVDHPGAVAIVPLLPDGRVVMVRQYRHAVGQVLCELPAGTLDPGESPEDCARRELAEETAYQASDLRLLLSIHLSPGYSSEIIHIFLATGLEPTAAAAPDEDERLSIMLLPMDEAVAMVGRGDLRNAAAVCGLLAAERWGRMASDRNRIAGAEDGLRRRDGKEQSR